MKPINFGGSGRRMLFPGISLAVLVLACCPVTALAQSTPISGITTIAPLPDSASTGSEILQASCQGCSSPSCGPPSYGPGILGYGKFGGPAGCASCGDFGGGGEGCGENGCIPGRQCCDTCEGQNRLTRIFCALHNALVCPDPCYEPQWIYAANGSLFTPAVRPGTYTMLQWDSGVNLTQPDRGEYFWPAIGKRGPSKPETGLSYNQLSFYAEAGTSKFSFFVNTPYINYRSNINGGAGNIGDLTLGTKTVIADSELLLSTFMLDFSIPTGNPSDGTGTGHFSLTPSLLWALKLYPETYWQGQLGYWMPFGGTKGYESGILIFNNSLNHVLCQPLKDTELIGTIETSGYTFTSGGFTDPNTGFRVSGNNTTYFGLGPGLRFVWSDRLDVGFAVEFSLTQDHFAQTLYRTQFRWRF